MKKNVVKYLRNLGGEIPKEIKDNLYKEEYVAPAIIQVVEAALADPNIPDEKKKQYQALLDSGKITVKQQVVDEVVAKKAEKWMEKRIKADIKAGILPDPRKDEKLRDYIKKVWKGQKYVKPSLNS